MRNENDVNKTIDIYSDMILRICFCYLKTKEDSEDAFQDVFIKYLNCDTEFENEEHRKAWLIRVCINVCNDYLRKHFWKNKCSVEDLIMEPSSISNEESEILEIIRDLPNKYKNVIYMHYYEGYSAVEMAKILHKKENTVYSLMKRGRELLKTKIGGNGFE